ncbi:PEPxxWA-CTERM sorting domain-containing protein [Sphingomonas sp. 1P06PA]|uniref:PEPxxWA-CTERM sorting domain-containing protein n=1 Tax=Sphingomonas sp. 1P06PA TaxID=554121 RepID=UPI0039A4C7FA
MKALALAGLLAATATVSTAADAALLQFDITGDYTASFQIDSDPVPNEWIGGTGFVIWDVPVSSAASGAFDIGFFDGSLGGGLSIIDYVDFSTFFVADGPQLYTGPVNAPTFRTGTFSLSEYEGPGSYTLTISEIGTAVPEPASWALMIGGFGLIGSAMRRRPATPATSRAAA